MKRTVLICGLAAIVGMLVYPPWQRSEYYRDRGTTKYAFILS